MASPGVIISTKFVVSSSTGFSAYLNYMKRTKAVPTQTYSQYNFAFDDVKKRFLNI